jgi:plastocyanin
MILAAIGILLIVVAAAGAAGQTSVHRHSPRPGTPRRPTRPRRDLHGRAPPPLSGAPELTIEAGDLWFEPAGAEIEAGSTTDLVLANTGQAFHDLSIPELTVHLEAGAGETASTALRSSEAGRYEFSCTVPGHAAGGMRGELVVSASP